MYLRNIEIENFLSVGQVSYSFEDQGLVLVEGDNRDIESSSSNGAGKSNCMTEALCWVLFGQTTKGLAADQVLPADKKNGCRVQVLLDTPTNKLRVSRFRKHSDGKSSVRVEIDENSAWKDVSKSTNPATDKYLQTLIGIDKKTFLYTTILGQGLTFRFSQLADQDRKSVLEAVTDLEVFEKARKLARKQVQELNVEISRKTGQLEELQRNVQRTEESLSQARRDHAAAAERKEKRRTEIRKEMDDKRLSLAKLTQEKSSLELSAEDLQYKLLEDQLDRMKRDLAPMYEIESTVTLAARIAKSHLDQMRKIREAPVCPTCGAEISKQRFVEESKRRALQLTRAQRDVRAYESTIVPLQQEIEDTELKIQNAKEARRLADAKVLQLQQAISSAERDMDYYRRQLVDLDGDDQSLIVVEREEKALKDLGERKRVLQDDLSRDGTQLSDLDFWVTGFQEIRIRVIDQMLDYLNARLRHYCEIMTGGEIGVRLVHDEKGKIDLIVTTKGGSYASASGGEKDRIDIAIAFALHDLATKRTDFQSNVLVLDEVAVFVDEKGIERLMQLVAEKLDRVETTFLITQNPIFRGFCDTIWTVVKENNESRLEVA